MIELVCVSLMVMLALQQVYWSRQVQKLIDKLMSKNHAEYIQTQTPAVERKRPVIDDPEEDLRVLNQLNPFA